MADKIAKLLAKLPPKQLKIIQHIIVQLVENKDYSGLDIKALKNSKGLLRVRAGNYRVIFRIIENKILIVSISKRGERTYKGL